MRGARGKGSIPSPASLTARWPLPDRGRDRSVSLAQADWFDCSRVYWINDPDDYSQPVTEWSAKHADYARIVGCWRILMFQPDHGSVRTSKQGLMHIASRPDLIEAMVAKISECLRGVFTAPGAVGVAVHAEFLGFGRRFWPAGWHAPQAQPSGVATSACVETPIRHSAHEMTSSPSCTCAAASAPFWCDLIDAGLTVFRWRSSPPRILGCAELQREFGITVHFYGGVDDAVDHALWEAQRVVRREVASEIGQSWPAAGAISSSSCTTLMDDVHRHNNHPP